jgi:RimJ/RimL family protein N-acetyltransferase
MIRITQKLGMKEEVSRREVARKSGYYVDGVEFELLKPEFQPER